MKMEELFAKAKEKAQAAKTLLDAETVDMEQIKTLQTEAESLLEQANAMKAAQGVLDAVSEPVMPAELPTEPEQAEPEVKAVDIKKAAQQGVYTIRYGEPNSAIKAVLTDLHGSNFEAKRWEQNIAFNRYLRNVGREPDAKDHALLKEVILTPEYAMQAIKSGVDVSYTKATMVEAADTLGGYAYAN